MQEETLGEIQSVETEAAAFFDQISRYFISRAKVVSKVAKYPHLDDYRRAVQVTSAFIYYNRAQLAAQIDAYLKMWWHGVTDTAGARSQESVQLIYQNSFSTCWNFACRNWTKSSFSACG